MLDRAPGNSAPIGGLKMVNDSSWFAARPSGVDIYKTYAETFRRKKHLDRLVEEAKAITRCCARAGAAANSCKRRDRRRQRVTFSGCMWAEQAVEPRRIRDRCREGLLRDEAVERWLRR